MALLLPTCLMAAGPSPPSGSSSSQPGSPRPSPHRPGHSARAVPGSRGRARPKGSTAPSPRWHLMGGRLFKHTPSTAPAAGSAWLGGHRWSSLLWKKKKKSFSFSSVINSYNLALNNWLPWELLQHRLRFPLPAFLSDKDLHLHMLRFKLQPGYFMQIFLVCSIKSSSRAPASTATDA